MSTTVTVAAIPGVPRASVIEKPCAEFRQHRAYRALRRTLAPLPEVNKGEVWFAGDPRRPSLPLYVEAVDGPYVLLFDIHQQTRRWVLRRRMRPGVRGYRLVTPARPEGD
jgi:hypothetical protein